MYTVKYFLDFTAQRIAKRGLKQASHWHECATFVPAVPQQYGEPSRVILVGRSLLRQQVDA